MQSERAPRMGLPDLGVGVGLRVPHYAAIFDERPAVDWFEIISENFLVEGGLPLHNLGRALEHYRLVQHGVSLSIGAREPLDFTYLAKLKALVKRTGSPWVSDHLCWTGFGGVNLHDLLPLPYNEETVEHVAARARTVQDYLEVRLVLENVSSYLTYTSSVMTEWEFVSAVVERADCGLLLDVNNIYVSSYNHGFDANAYVDGVPHQRVVQMHLAGHTNRGAYIIDTHSDHVVDPVWELYRRACERTGRVSTLVEWDDDIPPLGTLLAEAEKARNIRDEVCGAGPLELDRVMAFLADTFRLPGSILENDAVSRASRAFVTGNDRLTPEEQVDIYRRQYWLRHVDSLVEDYPGVQHLLGEDAFEAFARAYLETHPPERPSLRDLGDRIVAFAARYEGFPSELRPACLEMLRYEHAFVDLFDGPDARPITPELLTSLPEEAWEIARIVLSPLVRPMRFEHAVHTLRVAVKSGAEPIPELEARAVHLVLFRKDFVIHFQELEPTPFALLEALERGEALVPACDRLASERDEAGQAELAEMVGSWFQRWTSQAWIVDVAL